jgi:hypothetical protein
MSRPPFRRVAVVEHAGTADHLGLLVEDQPGGLAVQLLELAQGQGRAILDLLLGHAAAGGDDGGHPLLIDRMVFADEAHRLLDGGFIRQLELDRGDVVREGRRDLEIHAHEDHRAAGVGEYVSDFAEPCDHQIEVGERAAVEIAAEVLEHEECFFGKLEDLLWRRLRIRRTKLGARRRRRRIAVCILPADRGRPDEDRTSTLGQFGCDVL